jgi:hypothetical protein
MHAHNGRDDHLDGRIMSGSKCVHDPLPYSGPSPPDETVVAGGAWTVTIRQIAPWCAGSQHPADTVEGTSIVHTRHASRLVRQHRPDGRPFIIREFVAHDSRLQFGSLKSCAGRPSIGKGPSIQRLLSEHSGHGRTLSSPAPVAIDPKRYEPMAAVSRGRPVSRLRSGMRAWIQRIHVSY